MTGTFDPTSHVSDGTGCPAVGSAPRLATAADAPVVTAILVEAFGEDLMWGPWAFPDPGTRRRYRQAVFALLVQGALEHSWVWVSADDAAAALWISPGGQELSSTQEEQIDRVLHESLGARAAAVLRAFEPFEAARPAEPHCYLTLLGTVPRQAGRGIGRRRLRSNLDVLDAQVAAAYLETTDALVPFYQRFGFRLIARFELDAGLTVNGMWRDLRPAADRSSSLTDV